MKYYEGLKNGMKDKSN